MSFCKECCAGLPEGAAFCPQCGAPVEGAQLPEAEVPKTEQSAAVPEPEKVETEPPVSEPEPQASASQPSPAGYNPYNPYFGDAERRDAAENKALGVLAYLGLLVLIPLFAKRESPFAQFHAKQGLTLFVAEIAFSLLQQVLRWGLRLVFGFVLFPVALNVILTLFDLAVTVVDILFLVLAIIGIVHVVGGEKKPLPVLGKLNLFQ